MTLEKLSDPVKNMDNRVTNDKNQNQFDVPRQRETLKNQITHTWNVLEG